MDKLDTTKASLKKFGITIAVVFLIMAIFILIRKKHNSTPPFIISTLFFLAAFFIPNLLKPVYIIWMRLAFVLSWVNTRLILLIIFYLALTPLGLIIKLFGVDSLDRRMEKNKASYWRKKEKKEFSPLDYERQF